MGWKLRKDKQPERPKSDPEAASEIEAVAAPPPAAEPETMPEPETTPEDEGPGAYIFDLSGDAFRTEPLPAEETPIALGGTPEEASAEAPSIPTLADLPAAEPVPAENAPEPKFIDAGAKEPEPTIGIPAPAEERETAMPPFLTTDSETDIPRVAPFIVDVPPPATDAPVAPTAAVGNLVVRLGNFTAAFPLTKETTIIGRPDSQTQSYPDVEIEMDDAVSRRHAQITQRDGEFFVVDLGSTNGTLLNGERLSPHEEKRLAHGDRVHIGERTEILFE